MGQVAIGFWLVPNEVVSHLALSCFRRRIVFFSRAQPHGTRKKTSPSTFRDSPTGQILIFHDISILNWFVGMSKFPLSKRTILPTIIKTTPSKRFSGLSTLLTSPFFLKGRGINFPSKFFSKSASSVFQHFRSNEALKQKLDGFNIPKSMKHGKNAIKIVSNLMILAGKFLDHP